MFWIFKASNKCFLRYLVDTKEVKKVMIANKSKPIYLFFHILKISTLFGSDRKQKHSFDFINDLGIFEILCFYLTTANVYIRNKYNDERTIKELDYYFCKVIEDSKVTKLDRINIGAVLDNRASWYKMSFKYNYPRQKTLAYLIHSINECNIKNAVHLIDTEDEDFNINSTIANNMLIDADIRVHFIGLDRIVSVELEKRIDEYYNLNC